jgi:hypothetical protein
LIVAGVLVANEKAKNKKKKEQLIETQVFKVEVQSRNETV